MSSKVRNRAETTPQVRHLTQRELAKRWNKSEATIERYRALGKPGRDASKPDFCDACFTGDYAIPLTDWQANSEKQLSLLQPAGQ